MIDEVFKPSFSVFGTSLVLILAASVIDQNSFKTKEGERLKNRIELISILESINVLVGADGVNGFSKWLTEVLSNLIDSFYIFNQFIGIA